MTSVKMLIAAMGAFLLAFLFVILAQMMINHLRTKQMNALRQLIDIQDRRITLIEGQLKEIKP